MKVKLLSEASETEELISKRWETFQDPEKIRDPKTSDTLRQDVLGRNIGPSLREFW